MGIEKKSGPQYYHRDNHLIIQFEVSLRSLDRKQPFRSTAMTSAVSLLAQKDRKLVSG